MLEKVLEKTLTEGINVKNRFIQKFEPLMRARDAETCYEVGRHTTKVKGLYLEVQLVNGRIRRYWFFRYGSKAGRSKLRSLGVYPQVTWAEATNSAARLRAQLLEGRPLGEGFHQAREKRQVYPTVREVVQACRDRLAVGWKKSSRDHKGWLTMMERYCFPVMGDKRTDDPRLQDYIEEMLMRPAQVKTSRFTYTATTRKRRAESATPAVDADGALQVDKSKSLWLTQHTTASRVLRKLDAAFELAQASGKMPKGDRPTVTVRPLLPSTRKAAKKKKRPAIPYAEAPTVWAKVGADAIYSTVSQFVALTVVRQEELQLAQAKEFDLKKREWRIPAEHMKSDKSEADDDQAVMAEGDHVVPLSDAAIAIIKPLLAKLRPDEVVFRSVKKPESPLPDGQLLQVVYRAGYKTRHTAHGWRSTFKDWARNELASTHQDFLSEMALAHAVGDKVVQAYGRDKCVKDRHSMMELWGKYLTMQAVVPMRARAA